MIRHFKKTLGIFLSAVIMLSIFCAMPISANAQSTQLIQAGNSYVLIDASTTMASAPEITYDTEYVSNISKTENRAVVYLKFQTHDKDAYYTLTSKNINIATHTWSKDLMVHFEIIDAIGERMTRIRLMCGSEGSTTYKLENNSTYYIKVYNNCWDNNDGGNFKVKLTYEEDPEPNEIKNALPVEIGENYYGNISSSDDTDYFVLKTGSATDYVFTAKNINLSSHSWSTDCMFRVTLFNEFSEELYSHKLTTGTEKSKDITLEPDSVYYVRAFDGWHTTGAYLFSLSEKKDDSLLGDVNGDGKISIDDATEIQKYLANMLDFTSEQKELADVDNNGSISIDDVTHIQKYLAGLAEM